MSKIFLKKCQCTVQTIDKTPNTPEKSNATPRDEIAFSTLAAEINSNAKLNNKNLVSPVLFDMPTKVTRKRRAK